MKTESPAPAPLVSDEQMRDHVKIGFSAMFGPSHTDIKGMTKEQIRDIYESELTKMRAERDELVGALQRMRKPFKVLNKEWALDWGRVNGACHHADRVLSKYKTE